MFRRGHESEEKCDIKGLLETRKICVCVCNVVVVGAMSAWDIGLAKGK